MLKLLNSMTMKKEIFTSREPGYVKVFTCGPSIYQRPHIGNYRTFLYEDILIRFLEYMGNRVDRIINMTDIEDKSIEEAHSRGENMADMTSDAAEYFKRETSELHIKLPDVLPSSSSTVQEAAEITKRLMEKGYAYSHEDGIFFDPLKVENFGKLFGLDMSKWPKKRVRFKRDTYIGNRWNRGDFILWHSDKGEHIHFWDSVVGRGRPSWNVQDPAIIHKHLGDQVDINCGGIDNIYRHHDYNIAIMEALTDKEYASIYLHGEHLVVDGKTMSKSRGNILYPEKVYARGYSPEELRFFLSSTRHYRKKLNFTWKHMDESSTRLKKLKELIIQISEGKESDDWRETEIDADVKGMIGRMTSEFEGKMNDDLNLPDGIGELEKSLEELINKFPDGLTGENSVFFLEMIGKLDKILYCLL